MSANRRDPAREFHEQWLGMVQPVEGLVVSIPSLLDAQCVLRLPLETRDRLLAHCRPAADGDGAARLVADLEGLLFDPDLLGFRPGDLDHGDDLPEDLSLWVPEGRQRIAPTSALVRKTPREVPDDAPAAARSAAGYDMFVWQLPDSLDLDRPETVTGTWAYAPTAKFDRLLRHCRVAIGVLTNGEALRLIYAPHGESSGWLTFRVEDMATVGGRPILDALVMLLGRASFRTRAPEARLPAILADSRKRQASVTEALAEQVFAALETLLTGFEAAASRDGTDSLEDARRQGDEHLYGGLLTVLLRLVFLLYAEDRDLVPIGDDLYAEHYSVLGLFDQLQADAGAYPDSMDRRFGAWGRLVALFRALWLGVEHGDLAMPPRRGDLFDANRYPFLEGWSVGGSAPVKLASARAAVRLPTVDDGTVFQVLRNLVILDGQRLSYRSLDVEQIGSVYEALMGYRVEKVMSPAVCLRQNRFWVESERLLAVAKNQHAAWLQSAAGLSRADAKKVAKAVSGAADPQAVLDALDAFRRRGTANAGAGRLVLQPGVERRRTSSHYTPRSLSEPIVRRTLEPLLATMGEAPPSERLLALKICDPAMGSGAFLVEACRFLADQVVAAWTREGALEAMAAGHDDVTNHARRLVAQRCLYGVDKNPFAVELAKLSLWLATLARDLPFTFLDHALRWGDALVGLDFDQIRGFHWQPEAQQDLASEALTAALDEAIALRRQIVDLAGEGAESQREKERLLRDADDALGHARLLGDLVVGAFFGADKKKAREQALGERLVAVNDWLAADAGEPPPELVGLQHEIRERLPVFHWMLEFPEVFYADRPDPLEGGKVNHLAFFDAFIGNPPFAGKNQITASGGPGYLDWLKTIHAGAHGNADLSAHFYRRTANLLGAHGTLGLIATNTIAQGDTRSTGLQALVQGDLEIYDATPTLRWPGNAAVTVSVVHLAKGRAAGHIDRRRLDGEVVPAINSRLRPKPDRPDPQKLISNQDVSFQGSIVLGMGFTLTPEEREALIAKNPRNAERIFPYLGGEEVNSSPTQSHHRYVISFGQMSLEEAEQWPDLLTIVREKVKPERNRSSHSTANWWHHERSRAELYDQIENLAQCLVTSQVSKHLIIASQPTDRIFSHALYGFPLGNWTAFAELQARAHEIWAILLGSSMKTDMRYSVADCFETFPFPQPDPRAEIPALEAIGERLYQERAQYLIDTDQGLTQCYNRLKDPRENDPRVLALRELHLDLDRAVLAAYGWNDIPVPPYTTPETDDEQRARQAFEDEIIDRLFLLNAERAEEERRLGLEASAAGKGKGKKRGRSKKGGHTGQGGLFG